MSSNNKKLIDIHSICVRSQSIVHPSKLIYLLILIRKYKWHRINNALSATSLYVEITLHHICFTQSAKNKWQRNVVGNRVNNNNDNDDFRTGGCVNRSFSYASKWDFYRSYIILIIFHASDFQFEYKSMKTHLFIRCKNTFYLAQCMSSLHNKIMACKKFWRKQKSGKRPHCQNVLI